MNPRFNKVVRADLDLITFLIDLVRHKQYNVNLSTQNAPCYCTWQQLHFILNFLENKFRKELSPAEKYKEFVQDEIAFLDSEIKNRCNKHFDFFELMIQQRQLKEDFDAIIGFYQEITRMLHFATFEKALKENRDCHQFIQLKYAYIEKNRVSLQLYFKYLEDFLNKRTKAKTITRV